MTTHNMPEVERVCDRVAILCRGKLVALDSPLALRKQHAERLVDVTLDDGSKHVFDADVEAQRQRLGEHVAAGRVASMRTREFDFHQAFLKLTGMQYE
jgi:ABC-2 type transport system ATP-binding protein